MTSFKVFKVGDTVRLRATVISINSVYGWLGVEFSDGGIGTVSKPGAGTELIEHAPTPGQRAYDAWRDPDAGEWVWLSAPDRARWERIATAARLPQ